MRQFLSRTAAAAAVLLVALPTTAGAAVDEFAAEADTSSVKLSVFENAVGSPLLDLVSTDAFAASDPTASASVGVIEVLGEQLFAVVEANSDGEPVRDPENEADDCTIPVDAPGLTLDAVCAVASADAGASDEATANATTDLLQVDVSGSFVSAVLTEPLDVLLNDLTDDIADGATADAIVMFSEECDEALAAANEGGGSEIANTTADLIGMLPEETEPATELSQELVRELGGDNPCSAIISLSIEDVVAPIIDVAPLADALAGVNLIELHVDGAKSDIAGADAALTSTATQAFVTLDGPALHFLDDVIVALLEGIRGGLIETMEEITGQELPGELEITDDVQGVLDMIPVFGIDDPLLTAEVFGGVVTATLDNEEGTTTSDGEKPYVDVTFAPGLMELLGQDAESGTVRLESGESQVIAEDTPLASTVSVGAVTTNDDAEFEDTGLRGSTATASATTVSLLSEVEGGIVLTLAESNAGVYGSLVTAASDPPGDDPLPNTGGGAAVAAALALGAALVLRRRRD